MVYALNHQLCCFCNFLKNSMRRNIIYSKLSKRNIMQNSKRAQNFQMKWYSSKNFSLYGLFYTPYYLGKMSSVCLLLRVLRSKKDKRSMHCCVTSPWRIHSTKRHITEKTTKVTKECSKSLYSHWGHRWGKVGNPWKHSTLPAVCIHFSMKKSFSVKNVAQRN